MKYAVVGLVVLLFIALGAVISTVIIYYAWNLAIQPIFHTAKITFLQALLLGVVLSLIGSFFKSTGK